MRARAARHRPAALCGLGLALALTAGVAARAGDPDTTDAEKLAAKVVYRQKGLTETRAVELLGQPAGRATKDGGTTMTWGAAGDPCTLTASFRAGALDGVTLTPCAGADKKACKTRAKPLLDAAPAPGSPAAASTASLMTLTNDAIVSMVKAGRPAQAIIARIRTEPCSFDLSVEATIKLRRDGVGESVIQAMTDRNCH